MEKFLLAYYIDFFLMLRYKINSFSEMPTNNYVESSFWNFDALFQPQQHPARDAHDTFFISGMFSTYTKYILKMYLIAFDYI